MNDALIIIKIIKENRLLSVFEKSYQEQAEYYYEPQTEKDEEMVAPLIMEPDEIGTNMLLVFAFSQTDASYEVEYMYLGEGKVIKRDDTVRIEYTMHRKIDSALVIDNVLSYSEMDLKNDFGIKSYVNVEYSQALITQLQELLTLRARLPERRDSTYMMRPEEQYLHEFAQYNENCEREWNHAGEQSERSEFQRDRERIVNSRAFRRMVDKAQIFTSSKGDHYRTRMTHSLEVAQIARSIANSLRLNIDLTEAIALGHDLGHTPFGHQGERTLDDIINGRTEVLERLSFETQNPYGGFKHNFQSARMLTQIEEKYLEHAGLDVSYQVLEGVLKHTTCLCKPCDGCRYSGNCKSGCCDILEFVDENVKEKLHMDKSFATTLEGQVVFLADEIAQRSHDIDDAFSSGLLTFAEFCDYLKLNKLKPLQDQVGATIQQVDQWQDRILVDREEMRTARIISDIVCYLVNDVVECSKRNMEEYERGDFYEQYHRFDKRLVTFSKEGEAVCLLLDKLISKRAINCLEVTRFDRNAAKIVKALFKAYFENPKLIHGGTLRRMYIDMLEYTDNVIDFVKGDPKLVKGEFQKIITYHYPPDLQAWSAEDREYYQKRKILIRHIVDFIAGMTDSYAINEYQRLS